MDFRSLTDLADQIREKLWNITVQSADIAYTDALEFYASVREAAKRRVDAAETPARRIISIFQTPPRRNRRHPAHRKKSQTRIQLTASRQTRRQARD
jgi:hypothetical protein